MMADPCWQTVGVWGDATCPELATATHCRQCDVFTRGGRVLLDREPPPDYGREAAEALAEPPAADEGPRVSALVFDLAGEALAWPLGSILEVETMRPIRTVPHRRDDLLLGLVNVRGELHIAVSLEVLFGRARPDVRALPDATRLLVVGEGRPEWVIPVGAALGMATLAPLGELRDVPVTVAKSDVPFVVGLFTWRERHVGVLDDGLVLGALRRRIG